MECPDGGAMTETCIVQRRNIVIAIHSGHKSTQDLVVLSRI